MKRFASLLIMLSIAIVASAQAEQPAEQPVPPAEEVPARPIQPGIVPPHGLLQSMVRFIHVAPNVEIQRVVLVDTIEDVTREEIHDLAYLEVTDYVPVLEGDHEVIIELAGVDQEEATQVVLDHTVSTIGGHHYTIALIGLTVPEDPASLDDGFFAWLEDIFTPDREDLALRTVVIEDIATVGLEPTEADVRIVHAAPGTEAVELVHVEDPDTVDVLARVGYADVSAQSVVHPDVGRLEIRMATSDVTLIDLSDVDLAPGMMHTFILAGTPIEDVPIEVEVLQDEWRDPLAIPPRAPRTIPAAGTWPAADAAWLNERLLEVEAWLIEAEQRLEPLREEEPAAEAMRDISDARLLLEQVRLQFERMAAPVEPIEPVDPENDDDE